MSGVVSGLFGGGDAAEDAAETQAAAQAQAAQFQLQGTREGIAEQRRQFDLTQAQLSPFRQAGIPALQQYMALLGLPNGSNTLGAFSPAATTQPTTSSQLTAEQIRQNLLASGQFSNTGEGILDPFTGQTRQFIHDPSNASAARTAERIRSQWQAYTSKYPGGIADSNKLGGGRTVGWEDFLTNVIGDQAADAGYFTTGPGAIDQAGLDAEVQRILAEQAAQPPATPGTGGTPGEETDPGISQEEALASLVELPGQRFIRERANRALLQNAAAMGGLGGGNVRTQLAQQAAGFAQQDLQNRFARLSPLISGGQNAAAGIGAAAQTTGGNISNLLASGAANQAQLAQQAGQARASGILGAQQANAQQAQQLLGTGLSLASAFSGGGSFLGALGGLLSDRNAKQNIDDMTPAECFEAVCNLDIKVWEYLPHLDMPQGRHIGPMAQDAPDCIKIDGKEMLDLHSELMLIAGAIQHMNERGMIKCH